VITWGDPFTGGDSSSVSSELSGGVKSIYALNDGFVALKEDGGLVVWGYIYEPSTEMEPALSNGVTDVFSSSDGHFAALKEDNTLLTWGWGYPHKIPFNVADNIKTVVSTDGAFAALKNDGSVIAWGSVEHGSDLTSVATNLADGVLEIYATNFLFAALKEDGSVVTWGDEGFSDSLPPQQLIGIKAIYTNKFSFAALREDGGVVTWGYKRTGGDSASVAFELKSDVKDIFPAPESFVAIKEDGSVISWGEGSDTSAVSHLLKPLR
jgi:alpha-tubulin suppressor-like RCC1 family protein